MFSCIRLTTILFVSFLSFNMSFPKYYFPILNETCDAFYYLKYVHIECDYKRKEATESDLITILFKNKLYWVIMSDIELDPTVIELYITNPSCAHNNIICAYDAENNIMYGEINETNKVKLLHVPLSV